MRPSSARDITQSADRSFPDDQIRPYMRTVSDREPGDEHGSSADIQVLTKTLTGELSSLWPAAEN